MNKKQLNLTLLLAVIITFFPLMMPIKSQTFFPPESQQKSLENRELLNKIAESLFLTSRDKKTGGGRGDICAVSPQAWVERSQQQTFLEPVQVLNSQPLFLWQTQDLEPTEIQVFEDSEIPQNPIWSGNIVDGKNYIIYQGEPLKAGKVYYWRLLAPGPKKQTYFQVISEQDSIHQELKQRETQLQSQGVSAEKIALEKANYLAEQDFWSDALRELFSVTNPSTELKETIQNIRAHNFCKN